ncbi:MAG: helix-turn-helix transcriptional regulator [Acidimicrobiales bacterium]
MPGFGTTGGGPSGPGKRIVSPALVGREAEFRLLVEAVAVPPAVIAVEGEAGIGKTRLVSELLDRPVVVRRRKVVVGRCHRIRDAFPLGPVVEAVRGLGDELRPMILSPVAGALRPLLPELADVLPPLPEPVDDRVAERHRVFRALAEVLGSLGPILVVLEDLHWADDQTVEFLSYIVADPPPDVVLILTFRGEEVSPTVRALTARLPPTITRTVVALGPLDIDDTGVLAAAILGVEGVSNEFATYLRERTSGLPFAMEEVLALLRARGSLVRRGGRWARKALDELEVPTAIRDSVLERVNQLSAMARAVAESAAVAQVPVPERVIIDMTGAPAGQAAKGIGEAMESGLLDDQRHGIGFRHLLATQAVYEDMPGIRRRELHGRAASAIADAVHPVPLGQVAHHLRHAGRLEAWAAAAETAADRAVELGHEVEAVRLLEDVLRQAPLEAEQRGRIAVKLGRAAVEALPTREVAELLSDALDDQQPPVVRGELRFLTAALLDSTGGDPAVQRSLYRDAVDELDERPDLKAWAMVGLGIPMAADVPLAENLSWLHRSLELAPAIGDPIFEVFLLGKAAMVLAPLGDTAWRRIVDRILERTGESPRKRREVNAYWSVGVEACYVGDHVTADRLVRTGLEGAVACESQRMELNLRSARTLLDYCRGAWDGLDATAEVLLDELAHENRARIDVEIVAACLAAAHGELDAAQLRLVDIVEQAERFGAFDLLPLPAAASIRLAVARGDLDSAAAGVHHILAVVEPKGVWGSLPRALPAMVHALTTTGAVDEARSLTTRWAGELGERDSPIGLAALRHAHGSVDAAADRPDDAARNLLAAADMYERLVCPYEAAQAREHAAGAALEAGVGEAETSLRSALETYERLGATWDFDRAAGTSRQHGWSVPARHRGGSRGYGSELSPREWEVAELAAIGRTNKEIGAELFLSPSTVNKHLGAAMRKLGVRSRTTLAHRLAGTRNGSFEP